MKKSTPDSWKTRKTKQRSNQPAETDPYSSLCGSIFAQTPSVMEKRRTLFVATVEHRVGSKVETIPLKGESLTDIYNAMQHFLGVQGRKVERDIIVLDEDAIGKERDRVLKEYRKLRKKTIGLLKNEIITKVNKFYGEYIDVQDLEDRITKTFNANIMPTVKDMVKHGDTRFGHIETEVFEIVSLERTDYITECEYVVKNRRVIKQSLI